MYNNTIEIFYRKLCFILYDIAYAPIGAHKKTRAIVRLVFGLSLAFLFHITIITGLDLDSSTTIALGGIVGIMLSTGCALSIQVHQYLFGTYIAMYQVRCVCLLTIPAFLGRGGRSLLKALVLGYVIAGPIFNLTYNGKEVVRTFACTTQLTYNLTKTRFDLMFQPFQQAILGMEKNSNDMRDTLASVEDFMSPIVEEMEDSNEMKRFNENNDYVENIQEKIESIEAMAHKHKKRRVGNESLDELYETKYHRKIEERCAEQLTRGSNRCRNIFHEMYDKCYNSVTWFAAWLLCWPMKLTFICNIVQGLGGSSICDSKDKVDSGIGNGYASLKETRDRLSGDMRDAQVQYKMNIEPLILDVHEASDTAQAVMHEFNIRHDFFDSSMTLLKRCLALIFLKIIYNAQHYHDRYLTDIEHDNCYITPYFYKIDARRKTRGSMIILPLKKNERTVLTESYAVIPSALEKKYFIGHTVKLFLEIVASTTIVLLDMLIFETLDVVRRHGHIEYIQVGHHDVKLNVRGTGIIASLITSIIQSFNLKKRVKMVISNGECLPVPTKLNNYVLIKIYGSYLAIWTMLLLASYTKRLQRKICEFFYVKREKRRILYLYNETLRRRLGHIRFMKDKVKKLIRQRLLERDMNPWTMLLTGSPYWCGWLRFFAFSRRKCLICGETEPRKISNFHICNTPGCSFIHCPECWQDIGEICFACTDSSSLSDSESRNDVYGHDIQSIS